MKRVIYGFLLLIYGTIFSQPIQIRVPLATGNDDVEVSATNFYSVSSDLDLGGFDSNINGAQYAALRFQNVALPPTAQITKAYIQFTANTPNTQTANLTIKCQKGNASPYLFNEKILLRTYTTPVVAWNPLAWRLAGEVGVKQQTADLSAQVQEAIAGSWQSGNALSFVLQGNATQNNIINARSYETLSTHFGAPELVIQYTNSTNPCSPDLTPPIITGCPTNISLTIPQGGGTTAVATWTVPIVTDNCTTNITPSVTSYPTAGLTRGSAFPIGSTTVVYDAKDAVNNNALPCNFTVLVNSGGLKTIRVPIINGSDDVEVGAANFYSGSSDLDLGGFDITIGRSQYTALRFQNIALPPNAQISKAYIQFTTNTPNPNTANLTIKCQQGNANPYNPTENLLSRTYVPTVVTWNPLAWTLAGEAGLKQQTANLSAQITAAIATGWQSGNALSFIVQGNATRDNIINARSYEKLASHAGAAELVIEYTIGTNPCSPDVVAPVFTNCPANMSLTTSTTTAVATWTAPTVTDNCTPNMTPSVISTPTAGLTSGSAFPVGTTTITYNAIDVADNNAIPCVFTVTVTASTALPMLYINEVAPQGTIAITSDWIELYNDATTTASLSDIYITNKIGTPFKYSLTGLTIPAKGFLLLLADNQPLLGNTHLNFKISASGEKLYLNRNVNGAAVQLAFFETPVSPFDEDNVTFGGLVEGQPAPVPAALTKFLGGSPNAANATGKRYFKVANSLPRGILTAPATVTLTAPAGSTIRYTTDNSMPTRTNGTIYTQPIAVNTTITLKTFGYSADSETKVEAFSYIFPVKGSELKFPDFVTPAEYEASMKLLPIVCISTTDTAYSRTEHLTTFEYIKKFGETGSVGVNCGINGYGNDSYNSDQKNMRLHFKNEYGYGNLEYPIFPKEDVDSYNPTTKFDVLDLKIGQDGPSSDGFGMIMTSQGLLCKTMREMGNIDLHTQYVHVMLNGKYHGVYVLKEHWDEHFGETYYGGDKDFYDEIDDENGWQNGAVHLDSDGNPQGTATNWNAMRTAAASNNFQGVKNYLNVKQYIDLMLNVMYFDNQWEFRAIADQNLVATKFVIENHDTDGALIKTIDDYITVHDNKWLNTPDFAEVFQGPGGVFGNLYANNKEFKTLVRDRVRETMQVPNGALTVNRIMTKFNQLKSVIRPVFNMELARFNATFYNNNPYYDQEFEADSAYMPTRFSFTLAKWLEKGLVHTLLPVTFSQPSGTNVKSPVLVTNPNNVGVVYYTLDGTDPMGNDGTIRPTAILYTNQLVLNVGSNNVVARVYFNQEFGPKTTAIYTVTAPLLASQSAQILTLHGRLDGQKALISWIAKTTQQADFFQIEKQNPQGVFETLQTVNAKYSNTTNGIELYDLLDENLTEGDNVYRIALFSLALDTPQYSNLINVKFKLVDIYTLYPNPTSEFFDIDLKAVEGKMVSISVFNNIGTLVFNEKIDKVASSKRVNTENLEIGQYHILIEVQGKKPVMKKLNVVR